MDLIFDFKNNRNKIIVFRGKVLPGIQYIYYLQQRNAQKYKQISNLSNHINFSLDKKQKIDFTAQFGNIVKINKMIIRYPTVFEIKFNLKCEI